MENRWRLFPVRVFGRNVGLQLLVYNCFFIGLLSLLSHQYQMSSVLYNDFLFNFIFFSLIISLSTSYIIVLPIWRVIIRSHRAANPKNYIQVLPDNDHFENDILTEEQGEFAELEYALYRLEKKIKKKQDQLLREREENQTFMSSVQEGLMSVNSELRLRYFNSQFAAQFISQQLMGQKDLYLQDLFRDPEIHRHFQAALTEGKAQKLTVQFRPVLDMQDHYFAISINPLRKVKNKEIQGAVGIFHDITELKKAEQIRIEFVGNASHELRTPLTSIKGYVETLKEDWVEQRFQDGEKFLNIISNNVNRLIELVNDLLSLSTLESVSELKIEKLTPLQISEHVLNELFILAQEKEISIKIISRIDYFYADPRKVEQVLRNLVNNSIKYIPQGKHIDIIWEKNGIGDIELRVKDNGPGIALEHHDRLFERFYRIDKGRTRDAGGTGLGLAIVRHIMQSHGGQVKISSELQQGCEFICTFPQKEV